MVEVKKRMRITSSSASMLVAKDSSMLPYIIGPIFALVGLIELILPGSYAERLPVWLSIIFVIFGVGVVLISTSFVTIWDRGRRIVRVSRSSIIRKSHMDIGFNEIRAIQLRQFSYNSYTNKGYQRMSEAVAFISLVNGSDVQISMDSARGSTGGLFSGPSGGQGPNRPSPMQRCLAEISQYIYKPLEIPPPQTASEALDAARKRAEAGIRAAQEVKSKKQ